MTLLVSSPSSAEATASIADPVLPKPAPAKVADDVVAHLQESPLYRDYAKAFEASTGLPLAMRRAGSLHSPLLGSKQVNSFCAIMAAKNKSCAACLRLQQAVEDKATTQPCTLECFAGLSETAVPIRVGEKVLGFLQTGQVLLHTPTEKRFKKVAREVEELGAEVDVVALKDAYMNSRVLPKTQYDGVVRMLDIFGQHLSAMSNQLMTRQATSESPMVGKARAYILEHLGEELTLSGVARAVAMSPFYFCKMFKKATGLTFVDYVSRLRVEKVKELLLNPHLRISEIAFATGFQSLSQFNRTFRRIAGESPSTYRIRHHGTSAAN